jgi:hypothetical protein
VVTVAKHQAEAEKFVVLQDIQDQVHEVAVDIIQIKDKKIFLGLLVNSIRK